MQPLFKLGHQVAVLLKSNSGVGHCAAGSSGRCCRITAAMNCAVQFHSLLLIQVAIEAHRLGVVSQHLFNYGS